MYDQLGEDGLKGQTPLSSGSCCNSTGHGASTMFGFDSKSANNLFAELFGYPNPFGGMGSMNDPRAAAYGFSSGLFGDISGSLKRGAGGSSGYMRKGAAIERTLMCSLEDLYMGSVKKMKIARDVIDNIGLVFSTNICSYTFWSSLLCVI